MSDGRGIPEFLLTEEVAEEAAASDGDARVPCEVWSRIVGYMRPVQNWNEGKQQEFEDRRTFEVHDGDLQALRA